MGAHSTITITPERARQFLIAKIVTADRETLGDVLDIFLDEHLYNCTILYSEENDDNILNNI